MMTQEWNTTWMMLVFSMPAFTSLVCAIIVIIYSHTVRNIPYKLTGTLVAALLISTFAWGCMVLYLQWPVLFIVFQAPFYYAIMMFYVLFYRIVFFLTRTGKKEQFSKIHYIVPIIIPAVLLIWSFFVTLDAQLHIVASRGQAMPGYEVYTRLFTSKATALLVWSITYNLLSIKRVTAYRRVIENYSADEGCSPVHWLRTFILYMFSVLLLPIIALGLGKGFFADSLWMLLPSMLTSVQIIILCYNIVSENYIVTTDADALSHIVQTKVRRINREHFEHYIQIRKPYMNPKLRITNMAADLHSNRTYLSNFINSEYGMNFSRYINRLRLKELEQLHLEPQNENVPEIHLILQAGFSCYRGYIRAKTKENKSKGHLSRKSFT